MEGYRFAADLLAHWSFPLQCDYIHATRYRGDTRGSTLHWRATPQTDIRGRHVLLVDDILDEGVTLQAIVASLAARAPASLRTVVMFDKQLPHQRMQADWVGLSCPDRYVFGYGNGL